MTTIQTLFGTFNDGELKSLKNSIDEMIVIMEKIDYQKESLKEVIDHINEELGIPKKIIRKMAKVQYKQSFDQEVSEQTEFESLFSGIQEIK